MPVDNYTYNCENTNEDVSSQELSTKCFTPQTLLFDTGFNIKCVSDTFIIQIGDNPYVPIKEFHSMLTESPEKVSLMSYNIDSEDVSDEKLFL